MKISRLHATIMMLGIVFYAETAAANSNSAGNKAAEAFFKQVEFRIDNITDNSVRIVARTPTPMFCPFTYGTDKNFGLMKFMDMTSPSQDHVITLNNLKKSTSYFLQMNAVLPGMLVYKSRIVRFSTGPNGKGVNSLQEGEGKPQVAEFKDASALLTMDAQVGQLKANYALMKFSSFKPAFSAINVRDKSGKSFLRRMSTVKPLYDHKIQIVGLIPRSVYQTNAVLVDRKGNVYATGVIKVDTPKMTGYVPEGTNIALLSEGASITGTSSEWSASFAGQMAINGNGETEWASDGDGNNSWIEVSLPEPKKIHAIGFWTRTMGDSAQASKISVVINGKTTFGPFKIPDATQPYYFKIPPIIAKKIKFKIMASNGGRTGAISVEAYTETNNP